MSSLHGVLKCLSFLHLLQIRQNHFNWYLRKLYVSNYRLQLYETATMPIDKTVLQKFVSQFYDADNELQCYGFTQTFERTA